MVARFVIGVVISLGVLAPTASARPLDAPVARASATCADYPNQAAAQRAADTRDGDGDGIYCESLPCPCLNPGDDDDGGSAPAPTPTPAPSKPSCSKPTRVQSISFSATRYPNIRKHALAAIKAGWPSVLVLNRPGADARRSRLLEGVPTRAGDDRDEYPPAVARGRGKGLVRGSNPRGWMADVDYVPSHENRSHGSSLGTKLRRFCNGTKFRYVFY
ncbi:NucA/NucB deoxyribonuclease domain-containing protein [Candidatus Solirubrobacter pratensis]|uniref:NucA/NucB deoxyribonuclease domain-containing protein n=1 Tax=Candidatus Solirubrobacter pratensis TaxID=1298857 RepID=UPI0012DC6125|nr:NucA/NucB deoxyribonuclease domain-containing protein [Candidatus Solirubrobacter pratensis]